MGSFIEKLRLLEHVLYRKITRDYYAGGLTRGIDSSREIKLRDNYFRDGMSEKGHI